MADAPDCSPIPFNRQLANLDVGETVATAKRLDRSTANEVSAVKAKLRASINPAVSKARTRLGHEFTTDTGEFVTQDAHIVVVATVTRTA